MLPTSREIEDAWGEVAEREEEPEAEQEPDTEKEAEEE